MNKPLRHCWLFLYSKVSNCRSLSGNWTVSISSIEQNSVSFIKATCISSLNLDIDLDWSIPWVESPGFRLLRLSFIYSIEVPLFPLPAWSFWALLKPTPLPAWAPQRSKRSSITRFAGIWVFRYPNSADKSMPQTSDSWLFAPPPQVVFFCLIQLVDLHNSFLFLCIWPHYRCPWQPRSRFAAVDFQRLLFFPSARSLLFEAVS